MRCVCVCVCVKMAAAAMTTMKVRCGASAAARTPASRRVQARAAGVVPKLEEVVSAVKRTAGAAVLATAVGMSTVAPAALANEFDILSNGAPEASFVLDDAGVLSISTRRELNGTLKKIKDEYGITLDVVTIRKLDIQPDAYDFSENVLNRWYKGEADKGIFLVVTSTNEGAVMAGKKVQNLVAAKLVDSIEAQNVPFLCEDEKYNEAVISSVKRIEAALEGKTDPGPPGGSKAVAERTFKTKGEVDEKRDTYKLVVGGLVALAFIIPMVQFIGYTQD